jgi:hypothetical protein
MVVDKLLISNDFEVPWLLLRPKCCSVAVRGAEFPRLKKRASSGSLLSLVMKQVFGNVLHEMKISMLVNARERMLRAYQPGAARSSVIGLTGALHAFKLRRKVFW